MRKERPLGRSRIAVLEATTGFEPVMEVLQTSALPLGHVAGLGRGAEDEIRTRDPLLGKEVLYR